MSDRHSSNKTEPKPSIVFLINFCKEYSFHDNGDSLRRNVWEHGTLAKPTLSWENEKCKPQAHPADPEAYPLRTKNASEYSHCFGPNDVQNLLIQQCFKNQIE